MQTLGAIKQAGYSYKSVRKEMAQNLAGLIRNHENIFPGLHGYQETVIPQVIHAILSGHNMVILGEKGQAKTRLMRSLTRLLDEKIPVLDGMEIPESPFQPVTPAAKKLLQQAGDDAPIRWLHREERYGERLAPGSRIADIIGDLDPAKIMSGHSLSAEEALHYGLLPRMNLGIFALNELPDLDYLVQVAMFNVLEESDLQIRGFPVRLQLDLMVCFTANPADYIRSGRIITQLKDRIGAEIRTHYPRNRSTGLDITRQEVSMPDSPEGVSMPPFMEEIIEEITLQARINPFVNKKSGVSARLSIANYETALASARRRILMLQKTEGMVRMTDLEHLQASSSGKIDLDPYRDETISESQVLRKIMDAAVKEVFLEYFSESRYGEMFEEAARQTWQAGGMETSDAMSDEAYKELINKLPAVQYLLKEKGWDQQWYAAGFELILEGLCVLQKLSRRRLGETISFRSIDVY